MKYKNIILICDYGLDDAAATAYILEHYNCFNRIDIIPVSGNMPLKTSQNNAMRILDNLKEIPDNVRIVDSSSFRQPAENLDYIHGKDGIGDILPLKFDTNIKMLDFDVWIKTITNDYLIVSLGPCTLTKVILEHIDLPLLIMGGNVSQKPNHYGYEFNHGMDIAAFEFCIKHKHIIATLDSCHNQYCNFYNINSNGNNLSARFIRRSVELSRQRNESEAYVYDFITIMYLFVPEKFSLTSAVDKDDNKLLMLNYIGEDFIC